MRRNALPCPGSIDDEKAAVVIDGTRVDVRQVRRNFRRAAPDYDAAAFLPREVACRMLERLACVKFSPSRILDLGCGTGASLFALKERYKNAVIVGADFSEAMLRAGRSRRLGFGWLIPSLLRNRSPLAAANAESLPFADGSMELVWSNLMLHWSNRPLAVFKEISRALKPGGLLMFSTLGPKTLTELRASFSDGYPHTQRFIGLRDYGDLLIQCGYRDPVVDTETITLTYPSLDGLFKDLRQNGATCADPARRRGLIGRAAWRTVEQRYHEQAVDGRLPATFEVIYGHAWKQALEPTIRILAAK